MKIPVLIPSLVLLAFALFQGCASSYIPPGERADLNAMTTGEVAEAFAVQPAKPFPAAIALVRIQDRDYSSYYTKKHGGVYAGDKYSVVLTRELEKDSHLQKIKDLPDVHGITLFNGMVLPATFNSIKDIRLAAARLNADMLLVYTVSTKYVSEDKFKPLTVITLGLSPNEIITSTATISALLIDVRTGYIYGTFESTETEDVVTNAWMSRDTADASRRSMEEKSFDKLVDEFTKMWPGVVTRFKDNL